MVRFIARHRLAVGIAALVAAGVVVFVLVWFQPQKLVIEKRVDEAAPSAPAAAQATAPPKQLQGEFRTFEHATSGRAVVIDTGSARVLRFEQFKTSNGPDVVVYLSAAFPKSVGDDTVAADF